MQTCHRNETGLFTDVLGIPFDVCKFTGIVVGIFSHLKKPTTCAATVVWRQNKYTTARGLTGSSENETMPL